MNIRLKKDKKLDPVDKPTRIPCIEVGDHVIYESITIIYFNTL